jgi:hypothetical protein
MADDDRTRSRAVLELSRVTRLKGRGDAALPTGLSEVRHARQLRDRHGLRESELAANDAPVLRASRLARTSPYVSQNTGFSCVDGENMAEMRRDDDTTVTRSSQH